MQVLHLEKIQNISLGSQVNPNDIYLIIKEDVDIFDSHSGKLIARFRTNVLSENNCQLFFNNIFPFAKSKSNFRTKSGNHKSVMSNIFGFYDRFGPQHFKKFSENLYSPLINVRQCAFNFTKQYNNVLPLVQEINSAFEKFVPDAFHLQNIESQKTYFKIPETCFTTCTTNVNFQTSVHIDKNDLETGFGNLIVLEKGRYKGGEICFHD
jgi:hypothetical protein